MRALLVIDIQNDFTEGGALGVAGGTQVARDVTNYLATRHGDYALVIASRDWHDGDSDNGGHFATDSAPNFVDTWPVHCVAGSFGAQYHPELDLQHITVHVKKGMGTPSYSLFDGVSDDGDTVANILATRGITDVDIVGIATDHCVLASALDALGEGLKVTILTDLIAAVSADSGVAALEKMRTKGATLHTSS